ncbi:MAG: hypothetical protein DRJ35_08580 [Thermoprotei archaeon]|nr:MAG: hypothetical protein DRJ35_08580 [Thermoprotei archaeon]
MLTPDGAARLHGHKGPFLALGYRAGEYAYKVLKPKNIKDLRCRVYLPLRTPYTCILDGIQASSGCTVGKRTLEFYESKDIRLVFETDEKTLVLYPKTIPLGYQDLERGFYDMLSKSFEEIFEVKIVG